MSTLVGNPRKHVSTTQGLDSFVTLGNERLAIRTPSFSVRDRIAPSSGGAAYMRKLTIDYTKVNTALTDFPVYIYISDLVKTHVMNSGQDFSAYDTDGNQIPSEIEFYDSSGGTGVLHGWAKLSTISASEDTAFYLYYGDASGTQPAAGSTYGKNNVWESSFKTVHHLADKSGDATKVSDSASGNFEGSKELVGGDTIIVADSARSGKYQNFTNTDAIGETVINVGNDDALNPLSITVMYFAKHKDP